MSFFACDCRLASAAVSNSFSSMKSRLVGFVPPALAAGGHCSCFSPVYVVVVGVVVVVVVVVVDAGCAVLVVRVLTNWRSIGRHDRDDREK